MGSAHSADDLSPSSVEDPSKAINRAIGVVTFMQIITALYGVGTIVFGLVLASRMVEDGYDTTYPLRGAGIASIIGGVFTSVVAYAVSEYMIARLTVMASSTGGQGTAA